MSNCWKPTNKKRIRKNIITVTTLKPSYNLSITYNIYPPINNTSQISFNTNESIYKFTLVGKCGINYTITALVPPNYHVDSQNPQIANVKNNKLTFVVIYGK